MNGWREESEAAALMDLTGTATASTETTPTRPKYPMNPFADGRRRTAGVGVADHEFDVVLNDIALRYRWRFYAAAFCCNSSIFMQRWKEVGKKDELEQRHFDEFYEEVFTELQRTYGPVEELNVCENIGEHMIGNVYVKFVYEEDAEKAVQGLENRWFNGQPIYAELSPVSDFREARCRQHEISTCSKGGFCNFMHLKDVSDEVYERCYANRGARYRSTRRHDRFYADDGYDRREGGNRDRGDRGGGGGGGRDRRRRDDRGDDHFYHDRR